MRYQIISEEKRGSTFAGTIPMTSKVETKPSKTRFFLQASLPGNHRRNKCIVKGFLLSLKVSITWIVRSLLYRKTFYPRL